MTPETSPRPSSDRSAAPSRGRVASFLLGAPRFHLAVIVVLAIATLWFAIWRLVSVGSLEGKVRAERKAARAAMIAQSGELLQLSATPMAWAIRAELLANDVGDIDAYMQKLIKEKYVKRIVLIDASGTIIASTNTKLKGQLARVAVPDVALASTQPTVAQAGEDLRLVVPVMDFERQIATLVIDYAGQSIDAKLGK